MDFKPTPVDLRLSLHHSQGPVYNSRGEKTPLATQPLPKRVRIPSLTAIHVVPTATQPRPLPSLSYPPIPTFQQLQCTQPHLQPCPYPTGTQPHPHDPPAMPQNTPTYPPYPTVPNHAQTFHSHAPNHTHIPSLSAICSNRSGSAGKGPSIMSSWIM